MDDPARFEDAPTTPGGAGFVRLGRARAFRDRVRHSPRWWIALSAALLLVTTLALTPAFLFFHNAHPLYTAATRGDIILTVRARGGIQMMEYGASFTIPGTLARVNVIPGQQVRKGDALATLDATGAKAAVSAAQASVGDARSDVTAAQSAADQTQVALSSAQSALTSQQTDATTACALQPPDPTACGTAQAAVARAQAAVDAAQAQVGTAQAQQAQAQSVLDSALNALAVAQASLAATTLTAPHDGVALAINGQVGDEITPGGAPFITLADMSQPLATALVSYRDIAAIEPDENTTLRTAQAAGSPAIRGLVTSVALQPQGSGDHLTYPVAIRIDPTSLKGAHLLPGMSADIVITTRVRLQVVILPAAAIAYARWAAPASGKGLVAAGQIKAALRAAGELEAQAISAGLDVAHDPPRPAYLIGLVNGKYVAIPVVLGLSDGQRQEIIAGLSAGQKVVSGQRDPFLG